MSILKEIMLSIVIPAYNEEQRLPKTVIETLQWIRGGPMSVEVLIVDDGSIDQTLTIAKNLAEKWENIRVLSRPHAGKGAAVRAGMLAARGHYVLFMDADGATRSTEIAKLMETLDEGYDVAVGSRVSKAREVVVRTSLARKSIGRIFAALVNLLAIRGIQDTQCGFKMFRQEVVRPIFSMQTLEGFAFDVEILFIATKRGFWLKEVPVNWEAQPGSKVNVMTDSFKMLCDIIRIRWIHRHLNGGFEHTSLKPTLTDQY
jgi:dolichyl-phosphate beta-glucosyltransferase